MAIDLSRCARCRTACHPPRVLCPACGAGTWTTEPCETGIVEECTTVAGAVPVVLASVRLAAGPVVIAALPAPVAEGNTVSLYLGPVRSVMALPVAGA